MSVKIGRQLSQQHYTSQTKRNVREEKKPKMDNETERITQDQH